MTASSTGQLPASAAHPAPATPPTADAPRSTAAIETTDLRKAYGSMVAVDGLTLSVQQGEVFGYLGANGAGKTTSVKMLLGLVKPTGGRARLLGRPLGDLEARRRIGFLPEQFRFHEWLKAWEFLDFHGQLLGLSVTARKARTEETLALVGLAGRADDRLRTFSKGMLQRVGLAQALLNEPDLVFLDEPTSALDPLGRRDVRELIRHLKARGTTVFLNSHLLTEVELVCDRVGFVHAGRLVEIANVADLVGQDLVFDFAVGPYPADLAAALAPFGRLLNQETGHLSLAVPERETVPTIIERLVRAGVRVYSATPRRRSLEDVYVSIVAANGNATLPGNGVVQPPRGHLQEGQRP